MNYIGITGHRGSGKTSVGYLLGNILDCLKGENTKEDIKKLYPEWCSIIKEHNNAIYDCCLDNVYFDEFGDMPKAFVASLLSVDMNILNNDTILDNNIASQYKFKVNVNKY